MVEHSLWERDVAGSNPVIPTCLLRQIMTEITQEEFESNIDSYMDKVEKDKEYFLIRTPEGKGFVIAPTDGLNLTEELL